MSINIYYLQQKCYFLSQQILLLKSTLKLALLYSEVYTEELYNPYFKIDWYTWGKIYTQGWQSMTINTYTYNSTIREPMKLLCVTVQVMMTSSNGNIFRVTGHLRGEFTGQRPVTRSFDVFFDLRLNKRLSKQWWGWWFETLLCPLWRHRNDTEYDYNHM